MYKGCRLRLAPLSFFSNARRSQEMNGAQRKQHQRRFGQEIDAVEVFNQLNSAIVRFPEYPRAIDTLQRQLPLLKKMQCQRQLPLLKKMQCLLSQRPRRSGDEGFTKRSGDEGFTKQNYIRGK